MGALAISAPVISSFSGLITAIIWHFLKGRRFLCDKIEESRRQDEVNKTNSIRRNIELIAGDAGHVPEKLEHILIGGRSALLTFHSRRK